jgi:hypothetical protein
MKKLVGYLIDRETGAGISGKSVFFEDLSSIAISSGTHGTKYQSVSTSTDADGRFQAIFELSPGPVNIRVEAAVDETKVRMHDEQAQLGGVWTSDLPTGYQAFGDGVIEDLLDEMDVSVVSAHTIRVKKGASFVDGHVFSILDMGGAAGVDVAGTANNNAAINPRIDTVCLKQWADTAADQDSGRQEIVIIEGSASNVAPTLPSSSDYTLLPLRDLSTAYLGSTKTLSTDRRVYAGGGSAAGSFPDGIEIGDGGVTITQAIQGSKTWDPTGYDPFQAQDFPVSRITTLTVTGAVKADICVGCSLSSITDGMWSLEGVVVANNKVHVVLQNYGDETSQDPGSGTLKCLVFKTA